MKRLITKALPFLFVLLILILGVNAFLHRQSDIAMPQKGEEPQVVKETLLTDSENVYTEQTPIEPRAFRAVKK